MKPKIYQLVCECGKHIGWSRLTNQRHLCFECVGKMCVEYINALHETPKEKR